LEKPQGLFNNFTREGVWAIVGRWIRIQRMRRGKGREGRRWWPKGGGETAATIDAARSSPEQSIQQLWSTVFQMD